MPKYPVIGIVMATLLEADPFIKGLSLQKCEADPFEAYQNKNIRLVISGMGKSDAAMASAWLILTAHPARIFNLGAAGAMNHSFALGEVIQVSKVVEPDRPILGTDRIYEHIPDMLKDFPAATLATQDKPVVLPEERRKISEIAQIADMEGAAVVQTCRRFNIPCYLFKFISDTPDNHHIIDNIRRCREAFYQAISTALET